jgi:hypothetical protein
MNNINYNIQGELKYNDRFIGPTANNSIQDNYEYLNIRDNDDKAEPVQNNKRKIVLTESENPWYNNVKFLNKKERVKKKDKQLKTKKSSDTSKYLNSDIVVCCLLITISVLIVAKRR